MVAAAIGNAEQQRAFEQYILEETVYAATPEARPEGVITLQQGTTLGILGVTLNDGRQATALFTSPARIAATFGTVGYVAMPGRELFALIRKDAAVLNPGHAYSVVWEPAVMSALLGVPTEHKIAAGTQMMLGTPKDVPEQLVIALKNAFSPLSEIGAAWLALAVWPDNGSQSWYLDVRSDAVDQESARRALSAAVKGLDLHGKPVDMAIHPTATPEGTGIVIIDGRANTPPSDTPKKGFFTRLFG